ncbi:MAG: transposase [Chitinophagaceae bacterium]
MEQQQQAVLNGKAMVRRTEEEIQKHLTDQEQSGFTVKEYCEMFDIVEQTFYSWIKKYRKGEEGLAGVQPGFTTIEIIPSAGSLKPELFAEVGKIKLYKQVSAEYLKALLS